MKILADKVIEKLLETFIAVDDSNLELTEVTAESNFMQNKKQHERMMKNMHVKYVKSHSAQKIILKFTSREFMEKK